MGNADIVAQTNARSEIDSILNQIAEMHLPVHPDAIRAVNALQLLASNLSEVIETQASSGNVVELERLIESFWMYGNLRNALTPEQNWIDTVNQIR